MDKIQIRQLIQRPNYLKDHNLKYIDLGATIVSALAKLREIVESLPQGERKALGRDCIDTIHTSYKEIAKDYDALQEGSACRNLLEDLAGTIESKEKECMEYLELSKRLTKRLMNDKR
jgi:hypothetical protein